MTQDSEAPTRDEIEREIVPDAILWQMNVDDMLETDTTCGISALNLMIRQMRLMAEASNYLLPRVKRARRRLARCQRRIAKFLSVRQEPR